MNRATNRAWGRSTSVACPRSGSNRSTISKAQSVSANSNRTLLKAYSSIRVSRMLWSKGRLSPQKTTYLIVCCLIQALKSTNLSRSRLPQIAISSYFRKTRWPSRLKAILAKLKLRVIKTRIRLKKSVRRRVPKRTKFQKMTLELARKASYWKQMRSIATQKMAIQLSKPVKRKMTPGKIGSNKTKRWKINFWTKSLSLNNTLK